jgi:SAM-dependent methyltransferase
VQVKARDRLGRAHYGDAWLYDRRYFRRTQDVAYYTRLCRAQKGTALELGAGTGRITLPLARAGVSVVALEREPGLRAQLQARLAKEPAAVRSRVRSVRGDFLRLPRLRERFAAVIAPFNALSHCYETDDLVRVLAGVQRLLAPGGVLAFDVPMPCAETMGYDPDRRYRVGNATGKDGMRYAYYESFEYDAAAQTMLTVAHYDAIGRSGRASPSARKSFVLPLLHRWYYPQELAFILQSAGYRVVSHAGGFAGEHLDADADSQVVVARPV